LAYVPHPAGGAVVPEPSAICLLALGGIGLAIYRRRHATGFVIATFVTIFAWAGASSMASASSAVWFTPVTTEEGESPPAGYVSQDLTVQSSTDWLDTGMRIVLTSGTIYQDNGAGTPSPIYKGPDPANFPFLPSLRWDSYVTGAGGLAAAAPSSAGGAFDLGGSATAAFTAAGVNLSWYTTSNTDTGKFTLGRFTLSSDAVGTWQLRLDSAEASAPYYSNVLLSGNVENGLLMGTSPPTTPGDFDGDGDVDGADFAVWQSHFPTGTGATLATGDADGDGDADGADFVVWQTNFPFTPGPGVSPVPEPQAVVLALIGIAAIAGARKFNRAFQ
jgi:hypothetical protein